MSGIFSYCHVRTCLFHRPGHPHLIPRDPDDHDVEGKRFSMTADGRIFNMCHSFPDETGVG